MGPLLVLILLFVVMYAAMIRPQQKRAREHQALVAAVQVGDEVMTTAGIFGTVTSIEGDVIGIEISPGVVMRVARAGIGRRLSQEIEEFETSESFDDLDDDFDETVADDTAPTNGEAATSESTPTSTATPSTPTSDPPAAPPPSPPNPPAAEAPPVTPSAPETPPMPGPGPGPAEPG